MRWWPLAVALVLAACKVRDPPPVTARWSDRFDRDSIGRNYNPTGPGYTVRGGVLAADGARGHPLWLRKKLPRDVRIDLDCWTVDPRADLEVEVFGDGRSFDPGGRAGVATGYQVMFGGFRGASSAIARLAAAGRNVVQRPTPAVVPNRRYHWRIVRAGRTVRWYVNDLKTPFLMYDDPQPLVGTGHHYFAFDDRDTSVRFDNLVITPL